MNESESRRQTKNDMSAIMHNETFTFRSVDDQLSFSTCKCHGSCTSKSHHTLMHFNLCLVFSTNFIDWNLTRWFSFNKRFKLEVTTLHGLKKKHGNPYLRSIAVIFSFWSYCLVRHLGPCWCPQQHDVFQRYFHDANFQNKMAGISNSETKQVLLASEAELYIEELKTYPLKEIGSPKWVYTKFFFRALSGVFQILITPNFFASKVWN